MIGRADRFFHLRLTVPSVTDWLDRHGEVPLPPYIGRPAARDDELRYQTVYARHPGAVAAPTAGLHFDQPMLERLRADGIALAWLTLHVGAGTFAPVQVDDLAQHRMHRERFNVPAATVEAIAAARARGGRVIAVGTTSLRALESAAAGGALVAGEAETALFVTPGYRFRVVDRLLTNFHLPRSTLLMLVSAFAGVEFDPRRLCARGAGAVPILQLRRRDAAGKSARQRLTPKADTRRRRRSATNAGNSTSGATFPAPAGGWGRCLLGSDDANRYPANQRQSLRKARRRRRPANSRHLSRLFHRQPCDPNPTRPCGRLRCAAAGPGHDARHGPGRGGAHRRPVQQVLGRDRGRLQCPDHRPHVHRGRPVAGRADPGLADRRVRLDPAVRGRDVRQRTAGRRDRCRRTRSRAAPWCWARSTSRTAATAPS